MVTQPVFYAQFVLAMAVASLAFAHHSTAPYDLLHGASVEGVVTRFAWENPHAHIYLDVRGEAGKLEHWTIEIDAPGVLRRLGRGKDTLSSGDKIAVAGAPAKDGSFQMKALTIQLPDGRKLLGVPKIEK